MKKRFLAFCLLILGFVTFAAGNIQFGIGSGYVFYGNKETRELLNSFDDPSSIIFSMDGSLSCPLADSIHFSLGLTSIFDGRWKDGDYVLLWDYAGTLGFDIYPSVAGLLFSVDYCLGRRTDSICLFSKSEVSSTNWGNGFALSVAYDFFYQKQTFSPEIAFSWRRMPRENYADNIIDLKIRLNL